MRNKLKLNKRGEVTFKIHIKADMNSYIRIISLFSSTIAIWVFDLYSYAHCYTHPYIQPTALFMFNRIQVFYSNNHSIGWEDLQKRDVLIKQKYDNHSTDKKYPIKDEIKRLKCRALQEHINRNSRSLQNFSLCRSYKIQMRKPHTVLDRAGIESKDFKKVFLYKPLADPDMDISPFLWDI